MQVVEVDTFDKVHSRLSTIDDARRSTIVSNLAINVVHLNSVGRIVKNLNNENKHIGNRMEWAFLEFLSENEIDYRKIRKESKELLQTNPSTEKRMVMTVVEHPEKEGYLRIYLNGSTDVFLTHCNEILLPNGLKEDFTYSRKEQLESEIISNYKEKCLRVLALGYKDIKAEDYNKMIAEEQKDLELIEKHFVLVCFIVLDDPTRGEEASKAVSDCKKASINIKVVSGDSSEATHKVAKDTGILCDFDEICASQVLLEGQEFRNRAGGIVTHSRKTRWGKDYVK